MTRYHFVTTTQYRRQYKKLTKQGLAMSKLDKVIDMLLEGKFLAEKYRDHPLMGKFNNYRECHVDPDWLLIYRRQDDMLILTAVQTGSHSELFG